MAIAFDVVTDGGLVNPGAGLSWNHTCTGSNLILHVGIFADTVSDLITGVTYNSVAMTRIDGFLLTGDRWMYVYELLNPASGTNQVVVSASGATVIGAMSISHTGAKQTGQPDAHTTKITVGLGANTDFTTTLTSIADNCWDLLFTKNTSGTITASTGSTKRLDSANGEAFCDSNAVIHPAGSYSMSVQCPNVANWGSIMLSMAPASTGPFYFLTNVVRN